MNQSLHYRICPCCTRAVPVESGEKYCINDGTAMLEQCRTCQAPILSPYAQNCFQCGLAFEFLPVAKKIVQKKQSNRIFGNIGWLVVLLTVFVLWLNPTTQSLGAVYVGKIPQSQVFIAIALQQQRVLAYICDGQKTAEWFKGTIGSDYSLELKSKNGAQLIAKINLQNVLGSLELANRNYAFAISLARDQAALYRAENSGAKKVVAGWIVLSNGQQQAALIDQFGVQKAPRLEDTSTIAALGLDLRIVNPNNPQGFPL